jgi:head-tail adaptor
MKKINLKFELDKKETFKKYNGKFVTDDMYDTVWRPTEDTAIYKPNATLFGDGVPLAYVITDAYSDDNDVVRDCLYSITDQSTMRGNCAGPITPESLGHPEWVEGVDYKLRSKNTYKIKNKNGKWGMIAYANPINSVMIGYKRGRFTGALGASGWIDDNPEKYKILETISNYNERAFMKADREIATRQKVWAETSVLPEHLVNGKGMFTTLSANRYNKDVTKAMSLHVDSGDVEFGMTTMCVFRKGDYTGAYLVFPRYGIAIDAPDNSVLIADSRELHGVSDISGTGERFSCVAYCDVRTATKGPKGKSEKLIGQRHRTKGLFE